MEQDIDGEEKARGQLTGELRIKKTQHMTTSRWQKGTRQEIIYHIYISLQEICWGNDGV